MGVLKGVMLRKGGCKEKLYNLVVLCWTTVFVHFSFFRDSSGGINIGAA